MHRRQTPTIVRVLKSKNAADEPIPGVPFQLPDRYAFFLTVYGLPGSGKSTTAYSLVKKQYAKCFDRIYIFSPSTIPDDIAKSLDPSRIHTNMDALSDVMTEVNALDDEKILFIVDDLAAEYGKGKALQELKALVWNRRHSAGGISIILLAQRIRSVPLGVRSMATHVLFFSLHSRLEVEHLFQDVLSNNLSKQEFALLKRDVFRGAPAHSSLMIDTHHDRLFFNLNEQLIFD